MKKLISMVDFLLYLDSQLPEALNFNSISAIMALKKQYYAQNLKYANFLKQPLTLGMFIPCSETGNFLREPINYSAFETGFASIDFNFNVVDCINYKEAKDRILFEGFTVCNRNEELDCIVRNDVHTSISWLEGKTIEDLVKYDLILTETAVELINA